MRFHRLFIVGLIIVFIIFSWDVFADTPRYIVDYSGIRTFNVENSTIFTGQVVIRNIDPSRWIKIEPLYYYETENIYVNYSSAFVTLNPLEYGTLDFEINVLDGICADIHRVDLIFRLREYEDQSGVGGNVGAAMGSSLGIAFNADVNSGISCDPSQNVRVVFYDKDGDGLWEPSSGEKKIEMGTARLYNRWIDTLALATDLSTGAGQYAVPTGILGALRNFYVTTDTSKYDVANPSELDKTWEGNLYVNRTGTASTIASAIQINNITDYSQISSLVPLRSRNTDQAGVWASGTISIGPDDKDQIISPIHWDYETDGTDFEYADLDYDGRIDPDDKDQIISTLYWDFPN